MTVVIPARAVIRPPYFFAAVPSGPSRDIVILINKGGKLAGVKTDRITCGALKDKVRSQDGHVHAHIGERGELVLMEHLQGLEFVDCNLRVC